MVQLQKMALKPKEQLVTRLFLSPKLKQSLNVLSYSTHDLINVVKDLAETNPFVSVKTPKNELQNLDWIGDQGSESLVDHLLSQVRLNSWTGKQKKAVTFLVYNLDQDGYLRADLPVLATQTELLLTDLLKAKKLLQSLEPCGIGGKNLDECLFIQAKQKNKFDETALTLLKNNQLELLAQPELWGESGYSTAELQAALSAIQTLNPTPASEFSSEQTQYLLPDLIYRIEDQRLSVETAQAQIPELVFDEKTFADLKGQSSNEQKEYFLKQKRQYTELKDEIAQRQKTMLRLGKYLGEYQHDFLFSLQKEKIKAIGLKEASQALNLAPSTISRAIKDKYIQCQNKIFSMKILFSRQVVQNISQEKIEAELTKMIVREDAAAPLSDQELVQKFAETGVNLSRRVVTKYRKKLGIANSYARKKT
ncbi:RNA polymerase factor sigma-54 [Lactobacillus sp. ESL0791]|uniref:RNA polymerase factor sigma-54 n=1 Tax=Lactobacillus sp. ESL0791 TaxID=2983234 RepID=UPI0023F691C3|nr:RNA polymerase factor sigma-54 [Lactobacillus sp. ESL0791]MDF7639553.1 RNA polymerase factor sigma-54 [Lactobacillus sp. ESL0791]